MRAQKVAAVVAMGLMALCGSAATTHSEGAGDKGESRAFMALKNRMKPPVARDIDTAATLGALLSRPGPEDWSVKRAARIEGYVIQVEKEEDGDMHVVLAEAPRESDTHKWVIVEVTPGYQKKGGMLGARGLRGLAGKHVRATGWLYREPDEDSPDPRGSLWEIHPVTSLSVVKGM